MTYTIEFTEKGESPSVHDINIAFQIWIMFYFVNLKRAFIGAGVWYQILNFKRGVYQRVGVYQIIYSITVYFMQ